MCTSTLLFPPELSVTTINYCGLKPGVSLAQKYDPQKEEELRLWINEVTGRKVPDNFMEGLKDGVILCELINALQPGTVRKINNSSQNWHQEAGNVESMYIYVYVNISTVMAALGAEANVMGCKQWFLISFLCTFTVINSGMTAPGTKRQIFDKKLDMESCDTATVSLQMGTNKVASQSGMTVYGLPRQVYDRKYCTYSEDYMDNGQDVREIDGYQYSD
uniref:Calponin n=1 Tax=Astyanax mexicanus TaxID=7994 RepID=A0A8B9JBK0_ASTMX